MPKKKEIDENEVVRLYTEEKWRTKDIALHFNVSTDVIRNRLHKNNVEFRTSSELNRQYYFNEEYFDVIDTKEKAYILGLLCADGWVAKGGNRGASPNLVGFAFQKRDEELIRFIIKELGSNKEIKYVKNNAQVVSHSVKMVGKLVEYGIVPNKSLTLNIKDVVEKAKIDDELIPSFLLGYFDGDGCIAYSQNRKYKNTILWLCHFVGTLETCQFLLDYFGIGFLVDEKSLNGKTYRYQVGGVNKVHEVLSVLYDQHSSFCLTRKYEKFLVLKSRLKQ